MKKNFIQPRWGWELWQNFYTVIRSLRDLGIFNQTVVVFSKERINYAI